MSRFIVGVTGASGSIYAKRLAEVLLGLGHEVHLVVTRNGSKVFEYETGCLLGAELFAHISTGKLVVHDIDDLFASVSSGSFKTDGMAVVPCSMATLSGIAAGTSNNLLERAADVCLKEKRRLVLVPRETPLSQIHLKNMLSLSQAGAVILPAAPGFYHKPQAVGDLVDFIVGRVLDSLGIDNELYEKWRQ